MMAKKRRSEDDATRPDMGDSAVAAAVDQHEAEMRGEANPPPSSEAAATEAAMAEPSKPKVPLRVFSRISGYKWDQMAGFESHAKRLKMGPMTVPEWHEALKEFMQRPV